MIKPWRIVSSKYLVGHPYLTLRADTCELGNGRTIDEYHIIEALEWVNVVALTDDGNVVLIREYRHGAGQVTVGLPSGSADPGETDIPATAARELREETGYVCDELVCVGRSYSNWARNNNQVSQ